MDFSTADILVGLAVIAVLAVAVAIVSARRTGTPSTPPKRPGPEDPGRHHVPQGLLDDPTARLTPDLLARLKKDQH